MTRKTPSPCLGAKRRAPHKGEGKPALSKRSASKGERELGGIAAILLRGLGTLIFLPFIYALGIVFLRHLGQLALKNWNLGYFVLGMVLYFVIHGFFYKPVFIYVVSHELTHALWAKLFGGKVKDLHVAGQGGRVTVNKTNILINLAPYFFPLYLLLFFFVDLVAAAKFHPYIVAMLGFMTGLHLILTVDSIHKDQPDLAETGFVFSVAFILFFNQALFCLILWRVDPVAFNPGSIYDEFFGRSWLVWGVIYSWLRGWLG